MGSFAKPWHLDSLFLIKRGHRLIWTDPKSGLETKVTAAARESDGLVVIEQNGTLLTCRVDLSETGQEGLRRPAGNNTLDDVKAQASQWCEQARPLCAARERSELGSLSARLEAIAAGIRLRRQLDGLGPDEPIESSRREVVRRLTELQLLADLAMTGLQPGTPTFQIVAARVKDGLVEARAAVRTALAGLRLGPMQQAMAIEGRGADLEWLSTLVARLDEETPHSSSAWLDVELQRLRTWLGTAPGPQPDPRDESLCAGCERMQAILLERRIQRELARPFVGWSADGLWAERFHLSRLQTQVETPELEPMAHMRKARPSADGAALWLVSLDQRRTELADEAAQRLSSLELPSRAEACEIIVQTAVDEVGEAIAFLEDMPLRRAVKRLKLMRGDLERLAEACWNWSREPKNGAARSSDGDTPDVPRAGPRSAGSVSRPG